MCEICLHNPCDSRCPNYVPKKISKYCEYCGQGIYEGEEYIENDDGEYMHFECIPSLRGLVEFLGYKIKELETIDD